jgi:hypothetical protein
MASDDARVAFEFVLLVPGRNLARKAAFSPPQKKGQMEAPLQASSRFLITFSTQKQSKNLSNRDRPRQSVVFGNLFFSHSYIVLKIKAENTVAS